MAGRVNDLLTGTGDLDSGFRDGLNNNLKTLDLALDIEQQARAGSDSNLQAQITTEQQARLAQVQAHLAQLAAHAAAAITLSPVTGLTASNLQSAVEQLRTMLTTIIAGPAPSTAEIQAARVGADNIARASLDILIKEIHAKLIAANSQTVALKHGLNLVTADEAGPVALTLRGNSLSNILGDIGNGSKMAPGEPPANASKVLKTDDGRYAQYTAAAAASDFGFTSNLGTRMDPTKYYLIVAEVKKAAGSFTSSKIILFTSNYSSQLKFSSIAAPGEWTKVFLKISPIDMGANTSFRVAVTGAGGIIGDTINIRDVSVVEVDTATYAKIGVDADYTGDNLIARYPYIDGVKHVTNPVVTKVGKNMLPPFVEWTRNAEAIINDPYSLTLTATGNDKHSLYDAPCLPNQAYIFTGGGNTGFRISSIDTAGVVTILYYAQTSRSFTSPANAKFIRITATNGSSGAGTYTFSNPQLELGSVATQFEPLNNDYLYAPATLVGYGGVQDVLTVRGTEASVLRRWKTGIMLDGSLSGWTNYSDYAGYKRVGIPLDLGLTVDYSSLDDKRFILTKSSGIPLNNNPSFPSADCAVLQLFASGGLKFTIADSESGWGEDYSPIGAEIKAWANGWKMNNGTFGTNYNGSGTKTWVAWNATSNTGAVTTVPTTLATGYTPYMLSYQLATPVTEVVQVEGSLSNHAGANLYEVGEGVIVRERVVPGWDTFNYNINHKNYGKLLNRTEKILNIYRNGVLDTGTWIQKSDANSNGKVHVATPANRFDSTAEYAVTYLALDKYAMTSPLVDASAEYATSSKMVQDQLVQRVADVETVSTINVNAIAEMYRRLKALGG